MEQPRQTPGPTRRLVSLAMLATMAYVLMLVSHVIPKVSGFLQFDLKDIPIIMGGFLFGPLAAASISAVVSLLELVTVSTTGPIGLLMNGLSSCSIACTAAVIYKWRQNLRGAVAGLIAGIIAATAVMLLWNWLITPLYMKVSREVVLGMLLPVFLPFNLLKGAANTAFALLLYKPVVLGLRKAGLAPRRRQAAAGAVFRVNIGVMLASLFVACSCVLLVLLWLGII